MKPRTMLTALIALVAGTLGAADVVVSADRLVGPVRAVGGVTGLPTPKGRWSMGNVKTFRSASFAALRFAVDDPRIEPSCRDAGAEYEGEALICVPRTCRLTDAEIIARLKALPKRIVPLGLEIGEAPDCPFTGAELWSAPKPADPDAFFARYVALAKTVRAELPSLKVGGPGLMGYRDWQDWTKRFLAAVSAAKAPLDFFTFQQRESNPRTPTVEPLRQLLDAGGFAAAELQCTYWTYMRGWHAHYARTELTDYSIRTRTRTKGAAYAAAQLCRFQNEPRVARAYFADADANTSESCLFDARTFDLLPPYWTFSAWSELAAKTQVVCTVAAKTDVFACAAADAQGVKLLVGRWNDDDRVRDGREVVFELATTAKVTRATARVTDGARVYESVPVAFADGRGKLALGPRAFALVTLTGEVRKPEKTAFRVLRPGAVKPERWLRTQLVRQAKGLTGRAERIYQDIGESDWLVNGNRGGQFAWERGPYYAKSLPTIAFQLDDAELKAKAKAWAEAYMASQTDAGDLGPGPCNWWAKMLVVHFLRDWYDATGDARAAEAVRRYFAFQAKDLLARPFASDSMWAVTRGGDEIEVAWWFYDATGDDFYREVAELLLRQTCDWAAWYRDGRGGVFSEPRWAGMANQGHIVNVMQGQKEPALRWRCSHEPLHRGGYAAYRDPAGWLMRKCGRPDTMVNGSEPIADRSSTQGTELCGIAERILSLRDTVQVLGDVQPADDLELVAYNTLPATITPDGLGMRYYNVLNLPECTNGKYGFANNGNGQFGVTPGPDAGFPCCRSNFHLAWPKFVQSLWMATPEGGLAAVAYGPCTVTTEAATIREETDYPFSDTVTLKVLAAQEKPFPIKLRIPTWARGADVAVNGVSVNGAVFGRFTTIDRAWKAGDEITLTLPGELTLSRGWINESVAVRRGSLLYALKIEPEWKELRSRKDDPELKTWEIGAKSPWNYALVLKGGALQVADERKTESVAEQPFELNAAPVALSVRAVRTDAGGWGSFRSDFPARAVEPPPSPLVVGSAAAETVTLVPLGCTQTRITLFPWTEERAIK